MANPRRLAMKIRSCDGKDRHETENSAHKMQNRLNLKLATGEPPFSHYKCRFCKGWHVGHSRNQEDGGQSQA